jgi:hypothetical protein
MSSFPIVSHEIAHLGAAGIGLFVLYWLMHPTVTANSGLAGYRPPPKTIVMLFREQVPLVGFYRIQWKLWKSIIPC